MVISFNTFLRKVLSFAKSYSLKIFTNHTIINILIVGSVNLIVKGLGFFKESIVAGSFGLSMLLDTFYIAVLIPTFINSVFVSQLNNIFIPNYITELKTSNGKGAFQSVSFILIILIASVLCLLSFLFTSTYVSLIFRGHTPEYYRLILKQFYCVVPSLFFWGFSSLLSALLVVNNRFLLTTLYPVLTSITVVICVVFFRNQLGVSVLATGMLSGSILEFLFLLISAIYLKELHLGVPGLNPNVMMMVKQIPARISSAFLVGLNPFIDQFFAAQLLIGSITAMNYGVKVPSFISSLLILALGNVLLPYFSKKVTEDINDAYKNLYKVLKYTFIGTTLVLVIIFIFSDAIVHLAFQRGKFSSHDTKIVSNIQKIYLIYIPFYTCNIILLKFLTSINKNSFMIWTSLLSLGLNLFFDIVLVKRYNIFGLAISTTITFVLTSFAFLIYAIQQQKKCNI